MRFTQKIIFIVCSLFIARSVFALVPIEDILIRHDISMTKGYSPRLTLRKGRSKAYFGPGISLLIINGKSFRLQRPPVYRNGKIHVSDDFEGFLTRNFLDRAVKYWQTVTVDAGHGGKDPGAISPYNGLQEKNVALKIARKVRELLEDAGIRVNMTRDRDIFIPLESRAHSANMARSNLFVSIHANANEGRHIRGVEVYYGDDWGKPRINCETRAHYLAGRLDLNRFLTGVRKFNYSRIQEVFFFKLMLEQANREGRKCAQIIARSLAQGLNTENRGVKTKNLRVIRRSACPAVLVEVGFLSNQAEARRLKETAYLFKAAESITEAILDYLQTNVKKE